MVIRNPSSNNSPSPEDLSRNLKTDDILGAQVKNAIHKYTDRGKKKLNFYP